MTSPDLNRNASPAARPDQRLNEESLQRIALAAIGHCRSGDWDNGFPILRHLLNQKTTFNSMPGIFYSFLGYGLASRERQYKYGLDLCKTGVRISDFEGETHLYLARTYMLLGSKKQAIAALDRGLRVNPNNPWLLQMRAEFGWRRAPLVASLARNHVVNRTYGELRSVVSPATKAPQKSDRRK